MPRWPFARHRTANQVRQEYRACRHPVEKVRWHAPWLLARTDELRTPAQVAGLVGLPAVTARAVLHRWNADGPAGVADGRRGNGSPPKPAARQRDALYAALQGRPPGGGPWTGPKAARYARDRWGVVACPQAGWRWPRDLGFTLQVPRPAQDRGGGHRHQAPGEGRADGRCPGRVRRPRRPGAGEGTGTDRRPGRVAHGQAAGRPAERPVPLPAALHPGVTAGRAVLGVGPGECGQRHVRPPGRPPAGGSPPLPAGRAATERRSKGLSGSAGPSAWSHNHSTRSGITWAALATVLAALPPGVGGYAQQVAVGGTVGAFRVYGLIDFLLVRWDGGSPRLVLVECKTSRRDRTYHRVQVAVYRMLLWGLLGGEPVAVGGSRVPPDAVECVVARLDAAAARPLDEIGSRSTRSATAASTRRTAWLRWPACAGSSWSGSTR